jgi:hypothetical protein
MAKQIELAENSPGWAKLCVTVNFVHGHAAAVKVLGSSANVTITFVHPLPKLCKLIAISIA